jgi:Tfp pilus assembly protein PilZ
MTENRERRYSQRHQFPESTVFCRESSALGIFRQYSDPFPLSDLNRSGLGFQTDRAFSFGDKIHLKVEIPGHHKIQVIGEVRWVSEDSMDQYKKVGIQFLPFGTMKGYNSFSAREKLERLITPLEQITPPSEEMMN